MILPRTFLKSRLERGVQGRRGEGRERGSKGKARVLQTNDEGSEPKMGWIWGPPPEKF